jgi:SAM-dependent methyltransferase
LVHHRSVSQPFGKDYAQLYDCIYETKDYAKEVDHLVTLLEKKGIPKGSKVLDYGCGTGRHAIELFNRGYLVTGADVSSAMCDIARLRCGQSVEILSIEGLSGREESFDAVVSMFDVFSYMTEESPAVHFLELLNIFCKEKGLIVFDTWHLAGLINDPPKFSTRELECPGVGRFERTMTPDTNWIDGVTQLRISLTSLDAPEQPAVTEQHSVRAWTITELNILSKLAGLDAMEFLKSPGLAIPASEEDWHVAVVAKPIKRARGYKVL